MTYLHIHPVVPVAHINDIGAQLLCHFIEPKKTGKAEVIISVRGREKILGTCNLEELGPSPQVISDILPKPPITLSVYVVDRLIRRTILDPQCTPDPLIVPVIERLRKGDPTLPENLRHMWSIYQQ